MSGQDTDGGLPQVDRWTLRERTAEALRMGIVEGNLAPGSRLRETQLSEELGVSRGTIREAILRLAEDGLVWVEARRGATVRRFGPDDIRQVYELREVLERLAARKAAQRPRAEVEPTLRSALVRLDRAAGGSFSERVMADSAFHGAICGLAQNTLLSGAWQRLAGPMRVALISAGPTEVLPLQTHERHSALVDVILAGDPDEAERHAAWHLRQSALRVQGVHEDGEGTSGSQPAGHGSARVETGANR